MLATNRPRFAAGCRLSVAIILLACCILAGFGAGTARSASVTRAPLATILSPEEDQLREGPTVAVAVRVRPGVRQFRARVDGRDVSGRFRVSSGSTRRARLRLQPGEHHLHVETRSGRTSDFDSVRFHVGRRSSALLSARLSRMPGAPGRLRVGLVVAHRAAIVRVTLNGRRVKNVPASGLRRTIVLDGDHGLHHGRNTLRIVAFSRSGAFDVVRRSHLVERRTVIPAAGAHRRARVNRSVHLDATRTRSPGRRVSFSWRIARRPEGSRATLSGATTARPRLVPDVHGRYLVKLAVRARHGDSATASALATDSLRVVAAPDAAPIGVAIDTLDSTAGAPAAITLGAPVNQRYAPPDPGAAVQLLVLDRATLALRANRSFPGTVAGMAALDAEVTLAGNDTLVVIATPQLGAVPVAPDPASLSYLNHALDHIDAPGVSAETKSFSAIGTRGGGPAQTNYGLRLAAPGVPASQLGALRGYLQLDSQQNFSYVSPDYVPFDTVAPGTTPNQAVITVGGETYSSQQLDSGGFFVLVLDAGTLAPLASETFPSPGGLLPMHALYQRFENDRGALVFTQTIGSVARPVPLPPAWNDVASDQQDLGGHRLLFQQLPYAGHGDYALVGPGGNGGCCISRWAKVASFAANRAPGRVTGTLARTPRSQYYPALAGPRVDVADSLPATAYQAAASGPFACPDTSPPPAGAQSGWGSSAPVWPCRDTAGHKAAISCIAANLMLPEPIERSYWAAGNVSWGDKLTVLTAMRYGSLPDYPACKDPTFSETQFNNVRAQLSSEFQALDQVLTGEQPLIRNLQAPLTEAQVGTYADLEAIASSIQASIKPPPTTFSVAPLDILAGVLDLGAATAGEEIDPLGLWGAIAYLASDTLNNANGTSVLNTRISVNASALGAQLESHYTQANERLPHVGDILVSDWGKLKAAAANAGPTGPWNWTAAMNDSAIEALTSSTKQTAYESLFPLAYELYELDDNSRPLPNASSPRASATPSQASAFKCAKPDPPALHPAIDNVFAPFRDEPANGQVKVATSGAARELWAFGDASTGFLNATKAPDIDGTPPSTLTTRMFGASPPDPSAPLGLIRYGIDVNSSGGFETVTNNGPPSSIANYVSDGSRSYGKYCTVDGHK